jgi:heme-degrading monooxygenase HmoA
MQVHLALYRWKAGTSSEQITEAMQAVEALASKVPGIVEISTGVNTSQYNEGYSHVILVRGENQEAIEAYRQHPDHKKVADAISLLEEHGIGVDLSTN